LGIGRGIHVRLRHPTIENVPAVKIAHVIAGDDFGGVETQFERLAHALHVAGIQQRLIVAPRADRAGRLRALGLDVVDMDLPGRVELMARRRLDAALSRYTPDIVLSWTPDVSGLVERCSYVHLGRVGPMFRAQSYETCAALWASNPAAVGTAAGWTPEKVRVLPNLPSFAVPRASAAAVDRKSLYTPPTARIILTAARLIKPRGVDILIDALTRLSSVYLWVAGDGSDRAWFEDHALARGMKPRVRFLGWQTDLRPYFALADAFVLAPRQDDSADAVIEAWAAGVPVVSSDALGPGLLIRDHETGILVPVDDAPAMAEAIRLVLSDRTFAGRLREAGLAAVAADFVPDGLVENYLCYLRSFLPGPAADAGATT
jgi:glycosyltransferase involved in cell wall biosynthesis